MRVTALSCFAILGCTSKPTPSPAPVAESEAFGPERQIFGRVHDAADHNRGIANATVRTGRDEVQTDLLGRYEAAAPTQEVAVFIHVDDPGWTPHVVHVHADPEDTEIWPGLLQWEDTERALGIMSATSNISPQFLDESAYLVVQVVIPNPAEVGVFNTAAVLVTTPDGAALPDAYRMQFNDALSTCLPARAESGAAEAGRDCDGILLYPEVPPGVPLTLDVEANGTLRCERNKRLLDAGGGEPTTTFSVTPEPGHLNIVRILCAHA